jgi:hypothetical protein
MRNVWELPLFANALGMQHLSQLPVRYFTGNLNNRSAIHSAATVQHCTLLQSKREVGLKSKNLRRHETLRGTRPD